jgi:PHD/YefM family antitoxin component YafN of YafNO toxin-antitoxin module
MIRTISAIEARQRFGQMMNEVQLRRDHYIVERDGKAMVAVVPVEEFHAWMRRREEFFELIEETHARNRDVDPELIQKEVAEAVAAVRRARRKKGVT